MRSEERKHQQNKFYTDPSSSSSSMAVDSLRQGMRLNDYLSNSNIVFSSSKHTEQETNIEDQSNENNENEPNRNNSCISNIANNNSNNFDIEKERRRKSRNISSNGNNSDSDESESRSNVNNKELETTLSSI